MKNRLIYHLIFYRIPKNASTSLMHKLKNYNLIKKYEDSFKKLADKKLYKDFFDPTHAKPEEVYNVFKTSVYQYFSFCVVRNPWDRVVSMYHFAQKEQLYRLYNFTQKPSFDSFCNILNERKDDKYFIATNKQIEWLDGKCKPEVILRFENLQKEFAEMLKEYGISHISPILPHVNSTKHSHYKDYYTPETKKIIANIFEEDIDTLKYTFD
jgi:hypothetical protein